MVLLSPDADAYVCIPVEGNRAFAEQMLVSFGFEDLSEQALSRIHSVYVSMRFSEGEGTKSIIEGFALGSIPKAASGLIFPASKGWVKNRDGAVERFARGSLQGSVPRSGVLLFASEGDIELLLQRLSSGGGEGGPVLPPRFDSAVRDAAAGLGARTGFFIQNPGKPLSRILGPDLTLPIQSAEAYLERNGMPDDALLSVYLETTDPRSARMAASLLRLAAGLSFTQDGRYLSLENRSFPLGTLAGAIKKMYF